MIVGDRKCFILGKMASTSPEFSWHGDRAELEAAGADYILPAIPDLEELLLE